MTKREASEEIRKIKVGAKDSGGNVVVDVLAIGNEYVIYEVDCPDVVGRLRVMIDGHTDESEKELAERFVAVKQKYVIAKGLLYRSSNLSMMKNRVANCLASVLASDKVNGDKEFDELIRDIRKETESLVSRHVAYVAPSALGALFSIVLAALWVSGVAHSELFKYLTLILMSASIGGGMSLLSNLKNVRFDEVGTRWYALLGLERLFLSALAAAVALILVKAKIIFGDFADKPVWSLLVILVLAAFSEMLVPSVLQSLEKRASVALPSATPAHTPALPAAAPQPKPVPAKVGAAKAGAAKVDASKGAKKAIEGNGAASKANANKAAEGQAADEEAEAEKAKAEGGAG